MDAPPPQIDRDLLAAVLVGTQAFFAIGNAMGREWDGGAVRTQDIDITRDHRIAVNVPADASVEDALRSRCLDFFPVPALDPRRPSTSITIRGATLRVDVLTPMIGRQRSDPVPLPGIGAVAAPVRFLDFLLAEHHPAVVVAGAGVLLEVPAPVRYAVHKLVLSRRRPPAYRAKALKDLTQARAILEPLVAENPHDVRRALRAGGGMARRFRQQLQTAISSLGEPPRTGLDALL